MKQVLKIVYIFLGLMILISIVQCKKNSEQLNISLHDKPLSVIQSYVQGNWKLQYEKGGFCATCTNYINNFYWNFTKDNKIQQTYNNTLITDTIINWEWSKPANVDSTYIINFSDKRGIPYFYVAYEIKNDTLVLMDAGNDPVSYYLTKSN